MDVQLKDSGERQAFSTGSQRDSRKGKGRYDLLPAHALFETARVFEEGAIKYEPRNWEKGQPLSRYVDSALRHIFQVMEGKTDENHMANAAFNVLAFMETRHRIAAGLLPAELDDLPKHNPKLIPLEDLFGSDFSKLFQRFPPYTPTEAMKKEMGRG